MKYALLAAISAASGVVAWDVARTPPMGFNVRGQSAAQHNCHRWGSRPHFPPRPALQTWNLYHCGVSEAVLNATAHSMHDSGLQAAGYLYVNSDVRLFILSLPAWHLSNIAPRRPQDCWMLANRTADGRQIANPQKLCVHPLRRILLVYLRGSSSFICARRR